MSAEIAIYTAIAGNIGALREPDVVAPGCRYICFSDNPHLSSKHWEIRPLSPYARDAADYVRTAKRPKIMPHECLAEFETSIWVDENLTLRGDLRALADAALSEGHALAMYGHPEARGSVYEEAEICIKLGKDDPAIIQKQVGAYRETGFVQEAPLPACMLIIRRHHDVDLIALAEEWWRHIERFSRRDQISFDFVRAQSGLAYRRLEGNVRDNEYVLWRAHDRTRQARSMERAFTTSDYNLVSFPKSGRTWVRYFLRAYFERALKVSGDLDFPKTKTSPGIAFKHDYAQLYQDCPGAPRIVFDALLLANPLIVLTRDPRDVAISYFHQKAYREGWGVPDIDAFLFDEIYGIERQSLFVLRLIELFERHAGAKLWLSYEALRTNPEGEFRRLLAFLLNKPLDEVAFGESLEVSDFSRMQNMEREMSAPGSRLGVAKAEGGLKSMKVRQGKVGGWRDVVSPCDQRRISALSATSHLIERLGLDR
jgi:hypothetical protein